MYSRLYRNILFPFYETVIRGRSTLKYVMSLEESQWYPRERLEELQWNKIARIVRHAYANVPYYKELFDKAGLRPEDIKTVADLSKIPLLTKDDIRNNEDRLLAQNFKAIKTFDTATGGSTGAPLRLKLDHDNYEWRQAAVKRVYSWAGYEYGEKTVFIWGGSVGKVSRIKEFKHAIDGWLKRHKIYNSFTFTRDNMPRYLKEINSYKPKVIIGYTTPLYNFARFIKENELQAWHPQSIITGAEKLYSYQKRLIEEVFACPVFDTYGCREVTSIAGECGEHNGMHINMENIYLEVTKDGEIVVTDLTNYCMPLIRYKNEDIGRLSNKRCSCGRGLALLEKVEGRILDIIRTPDGKMVPGEFFPHLMKEFAEIDRFQVTQEDLNNMTLKIVKRNDLSSERLSFMKSEISKVMGDKIAVDLKFVDEISLTTSGKFRVVTSRIAGGKDGR